MFVMAGVNANPETFKGAMSRTPLGRSGTARGVGDGCFPLLKKASYITGETICGWWASWSRYVDEAVPVGLCASSSRRRAQALRSASLIWQWAGLRQLSNCSARLVCGVSQSQLLNALPHPLPGWNKVTPTFHGRRR